MHTEEGAQGCRGLLDRCSKNEKQALLGVKGPKSFANCVPVLATEDSEDAYC
jgi:propanediol dehydratase large subunit